MNEVLFKVLCMYEFRIWWVFQGGSKGNPGILKERAFSENASHTFLKNDMT